MRYLYQRRRVFFFYSGMQFYVALSLAHLIAASRAHAGKLGRLGEASIDRSLFVRFDGLRPLEKRMRFERLVLVLSISWTIAGTLIVSCAAPTPSITPSSAVASPGPSLGSSPPVITTSPVEQSSAAPPVPSVTPAALQGPIYSLTWSPDNKTIAAATSTGIVLFDASTLSPYQTIDPGERAESLVYSSDGLRLACTCGEGLIKIWEVKSGGLLSTLLNAKFFTSVAFNPNGTQFAGGDFDGKVRVWNANGNSLLFTLAGPQASVFRLAFSSDGTRILSGNLSGTVKVWNVTTGEVIHEFPDDSGFFDIQFSPDGRHVATSNQSGDTIRVWDVSTGQLLITLAQMRVVQFTFANQNRAIVCLCQEGTLAWDAGNGKALGRLAGYDPDISNMAASPDGQFLAFGTHEGKIKTLTWSLPMPTPPALTPLPSTPTAVPLRTSPTSTQPSLVPTRAEADNGYPPWVGTPAIGPHPRSDQPLPVGVANGDIIASGNLLWFIWENTKSRIWFPNAAEPYLSSYQVGPDVTRRLRGIPLGSESPPRWIILFAKTQDQQRIGQVYTVDMLKHIMYPLRHPDVAWDQAEKIPTAVGDQYTPILSGD